MSKESQKNLINFQNIKNVSNKIKNFEYMRESADNFEYRKNFDHIERISIISVNFQTCLNLTFQIF